ncbi:hypothetical protein E2493_12345 [Sphingomonas parva]|uniref:Uncharacterized protein n=1 Tax=Sphingomonas parva TaxID=2555898 RepID=A0A4Y8ZT88_9SPHN|nr:hypothetical protein [Sphingomonas parva]TFI57979.1 hypothetical protein E2493_12345 [Sphingomonas parva]
MRNELLTAAALLALAGCSEAPPGNDAANAADPVSNTVGNAPASSPAPEDGAAAPAPLPPVEPSAPGTPGGLPDDRTPVSEAPFSEESAQGAANVVQTYYALLEAGKHREAWRLWSDGGKASGMDAEAFAASFAKYGEYHAQVGAPGPMQGAAGSSYVEVPVVVYGRLKSGAEVHMNGPVTLRRVNDVPGATAEQRKWHIHSSGVKPRPR